MFRYSGCQEVQIDKEHVLKLRGVKTFPTKTRRDVGMVPRVSEEHVCLHGKTNWWKTPGTRRGHQTR